MGEKRILYSIVVGKPWEKRSLGRPRRRWEDNIRRNIFEVDVQDKNWLDVAQNPMAKICYFGDELASSVCHRVSYFVIGESKRSWFLSFLLAPQRKQARRN